MCLRRHSPDFLMARLGIKQRRKKLGEVFQATYAFEQFVLEYAQYHLNKTTPNLSINSQEIGKGKKKKDLLPVVS